MKVAFITTVGHNVGDDFVRDGLSHLLRRVCGPFESRLIHKHFPMSSRDGWERWHLTRTGRFLLRLPGLRRAGRLSRWLDARPLDRRRDAVGTCDLLVQSGAPVYWLNPSGACEDNEWYGPLIRNRWQRREPRPPLLNLAAGACQPLDSDASEFSGAEATLAFIREFFAACRLTTVRDRLSERILEIAGLHAPRLPCASIFARDWHEVSPQPGSYVALNFMALGGHYDLDGGARAERWRETFTAVLDAVSRNERCVLACHDRDEEALARRWFPGIERFLPADSRDALRFYAGASSGILNRVHGALALASFGRPAVIVGADSRARMGEELGMPIVSVATATAEEILSAHAAARRDEPGFAARMNEIRAASERRYLELLHDALRGARS